MQWSLIFEDVRIRPSFDRLDRNQKVLVVASYLYRQLRLMRAFDQCYCENLSELFIHALDVALSTSGEPGVTQGEVYKNIPDTDEYSEQEGSYAQNLMIALNYLLLFVLNNDQIDLSRCVEMSLQNIDLINYEVNENYDEKLVTSKEVDVVTDLVVSALRASRGQLFSVKDAERLASNHYL
uniref:Uncharacterized protein n=1 Tax=Pseudomonas graminis TaxID=158627 RepID=A0A7C2AKI7_9PSED